jgi:acid phosphatase type 7
MKTMQGRFRAAALMAAAVSVLAFAAGAKAQDPKANGNLWPYATTGKSPVLVVVGDIACQPGGETETTTSGTPPVTTVTVLAPAGEANKEFCFNPKSPNTNIDLWQSQEATANQIENIKPDAVAIVGDLQYQVGQYSDFEQSYDLTYGAFKAITRPAPGNHEFYDEHSERGVGGYGYFSYFNGFLINAPTPTTISGNPSTTTGNPALPIMATVPEQCTAALSAACNYPGATPFNPQPIPRADGQAGHFETSGGIGSTAANPIGVGDGWYSYNLGSWHLISLNIECSTQPGGCSDTGPWFAAELEWLKKDLEENHSACTAAYWHQPTFSATNGISPEGIAAQAFWQLLYDNRADLVLNGHDHLYARYQPLAPNGTPDKERGIREFIVGTGGETLDPIVYTPSSGTNLEDPSGNTSFNANYLEAYTGDYWGVMALKLDHNGYHWDFESALAGPAGLVALNGPTSPAPNTNGGYSDTGFGFCHNTPDRDRHDDDDDHGR